MLKTFKVLVSLLVLFFAFNIARIMILKPGSDDPGEPELSAAERLITSNRQGVAHGNTSEAKALAASFAEIFKTARAQLVEKAESGKYSITDGEFPTFCLVSDDCVVFLVQVPQLRKFSQRAKEVICETGWEIAGALTEKGFENPPKKLVVGIRGLASYAAKYEGERSETGVYEIRRDLGSSAELRAFFIPKVPAKTG